MAAKTSKQKNTPSPQTRSKHDSGTPAVTKELPLAPPVQGSEQEYQRFLPEALLIPASEVKPFRADASLAYHNVLHGVESVLAKEAELRAMLPHEDFDRLRALPNIVLGLIFSVLAVEGSPEEPRTVREELREARALRRTMLKGLDALKEAGFFTQKEYDAIAAGRGPLDAVNDCLALSAKYREKWSAIRSRTAITLPQIARAAELGTSLQAHFKPGRARRSNAKTGAAAEAAERRDRLWTLVTRGNDRLWSVGTLVYGRAIDDHVPALQTARRRTTAGQRAASAQRAADDAATKAQKATAKAQEATAKKNGVTTPA